MSFILAITALNYLSSGLPSFYIQAPSTPVTTPSWHPKEQAYLSHFTPAFYEKYLGLGIDPQEILRFDPNDKRSKFLFAAAESDSHNPGSSSPTTKFIEDLNQKYDVKYKVIKTQEELCDEIAQTAKVTKLSYVLLEGEHHADKGICLSNCSLSSHFFHPKNDLHNCFKPLHSHGEVILYSNHTGANTFAQEVAHAVKRHVMAPTAQLQERTYLDPSNLKPVNLEKYDRREGWRPRNNLFKTFYPKYTNCQTVNQADLHPREKRVDERITDTDDPRKKFLYLSMEADWNGALNPSSLTDFLKKISYEYDLKFKVMSSYAQLCDEVQATASTGPINLLLDGHGTPEGIHITGHYWTNTSRIVKENVLHAERNLTECFKGANITKIALFACNANAPFNGDSKGNIAHAIANQTRTPVIGATEPTYATKIKITSLDPFEIYHPSEHKPWWHWQSVNIFQTVYPPKEHTHSGG